MELPAHSALTRINSVKVQKEYFLFGKSALTLHWDSATELWQFTFCDTTYRLYVKYDSMWAN